MPSIMISDEQRREFELNGFLQIDNALDLDEIARYLKVVDRLDHNQPTTHGGKSRVAGEPLELRNSVVHAPELLDLMTHESAFPAIVDLMGHNIAITTSHVFIRPSSPPGTAKSFKAIGWHKDGPPGEWTKPMNGQSPWLYTKIGYFLTDLTIPDAGALRVVPGSHRVLNPAWKTGDPDPYGMVELKVKPGTAVIFENRLWHAVGPNYSSVPRKNIYFGYCWRWMRPIDYVQQPQELIEKLTPIQRQLMGDVKTELGFILPQDVDVPLKQWAKERAKDQPTTVRETAEVAMI